LAVTDTRGSQAFVWPIRVYYEDTDAQGLVYYANYFKFMERARTEWIRTLGIEQDVMLNEERRCFVVVETYASFISPARFNDQLVATARMSEHTKATFMIEQNIHRMSIEGELLCKGTTKAAFIDTDTLKPLRLPAVLFEDPES
jgi:acyl-CoA thioester hydrolase